MCFKCYKCGKDCEHGAWKDHKIKSGKTSVMIRVPLCKDCLKEWNEGDVNGS